MDRHFSYEDRMKRVDQVIKQVVQYKVLISTAFYLLINCLHCSHLSRHTNIQLNLIAKLAWINEMC